MSEVAPGLRIFHHPTRLSEPRNPGAVDLVDWRFGESRIIAEDVPYPAALVLALRRRRSGDEVKILDFSKSLTNPEEY